MEGKTDGSPRKPHNLSAKILRIYLSEGINHVVTPKNVHRRLRLAYPEISSSSVLCAIRNLFRQNLLLRSNRGGYFLPDEKKARTYIEEHISIQGGVSSSSKLGVVREEWFDASRWLDLSGAVVEFGRFDFRVDSFDRDLIRERMGKLGIRWSARDRSRWIAVNRESFSLTISRKGGTRLYLHSVEGLDALSGFLSECGLSDVRKKIFFSRFFEIAEKGKLSAEFDVLAPAPDLPSVYVAETRVGNHIVRTRLNYSGGRAELESAGSLPAVQHFLLHVVGVQHTSIVEYLQTEKLSNMEELLSKILTEHKDIREAFQKNAEAFTLLSSTFERLAGGAQKEAQDSTEEKRKDKERPGVG